MLISDLWGSPATTKGDLEDLYYSQIGKMYDGSTIDRTVDDTRNTSLDIRVHVLKLYRERPVESQSFSEWFAGNKTALRNDVNRLLQRTSKNRGSNFSDKLLGKSFDNIDRGTKDAQDIIDVILDNMELGSARDSINVKRDITIETVQGKVSRWHRNVRFPFNKLVDIEEHSVQYGSPDRPIEPAFTTQQISEHYYTPVRKVDVKTLPGPKDYPFGEGPPSPSLTQRVDRIREIYADGILDNVGKAGLNPKFDIASHAVQPIQNWVHRLSIGEYLRSLQQSLIIHYNLMGFKFFKWVLTPVHTERLERYGMERDWCDDLAETPLEISIKNEKDRQLIYNMLDDSIPRYGPKLYKYWDGSKLEFRTKTLDLKFNGIFPTSLAGTKTVRTVVHKWRMAKVGKRGRIQRIYGRVIRDLRIPPHPFCSCMMIPLFDPSNPDDFLRKEKTILEKAVESRVGEQMARAQYEIAHESQRSKLTQAIVRTILMSYLGPDIADALAAPITVYGPDIVFLTPAELHDLPLYGAPEIRRAA